MKEVYLMKDLWEKYLLSMQVYQFPPTNYLLLLTVKMMGIWITLEGHLQ